MQGAGQQFAAYTIKRQQFALRKILPLFTPVNWGAIKVCPSAAPRSSIALIPYSTEDESLAAGVQAV